MIREMIKKLCDRKVTEAQVFVPIFVIMAFFVIMTLIKEGVI